MVESSELREAQYLLHEVVVPDQEYWRDQIKCQAACPVNTDARGYVRAIAEGNDELAYLIARGPNPLASICGRVCGAPCEQACRRGDYDDPVSIRALKRFVCDKFGSEARINNSRGLIEFMKETAGRHKTHENERQEELLPLLQSLTSGDIAKVENKSVGIIGSGPAGLAAAHDLAVLGFSVTIYELEAVLAGMLAFGIPEYRLPRDLIQAEVDVILGLGVEAVTNCTVGKDVSFSELRKKHDTVIIAVGCKVSRGLPIPGADADGVLGGVEFLRDVSVGDSTDLGEKVVVIGGGNVAYDVGRTVVRQISIDAARVAKRESGVGEVYLCSLESLDDMPADDIEIIEGDEEGVIRRNSLGPKEILTDENGKVRGVRFVRCLRVFDENQRFAPLFDDDDVTEIECDRVLVAIGQSSNLSFIDAEAEYLKMDPRGLIVCDPNSGATNQPDIYVAGDLAYGPKLLIHAVAHGKSVARDIYRQFTGNQITSRDVELHFPISDYKRESDYEKIPRYIPPTIPAEERIKSQSMIVEKNFSEEQARCEAARCLNCGINTIFHGDKCILCGGCVDVCPENCLSIIPLSQIAAGKDSMRRVIDEQLGHFPSHEASAIIKDETTCIRCALCAERCPNGAITMEQYIGKELPRCLVV